ncbi:transposable element Tcb2 transposase [Trichonephila clavipes]|nr:transposable element Tcb2 transposase [Trichonephila clavipes]
MEAGWSNRRVARRLGHPDCVVRRCWDQWIREMSFTRRSGSGRPLQTSHLENRHICCPWHLPIEASVWSGTCRGSCTAEEWNQFVFRDDSRFNLSSDDNRVYARSSVSPRITHSQPKIETEVGHSVELPCAAQGYPLPKYS